MVFTAARNPLSSHAFIVDRIGIVDVRQQKLIFTYGRGAFEPGAVNVADVSMEIRDQERITRLNAARDEHGAAVS